MKKILYYFAQGLLLICSVLLGFISGTETLILCLSCLATGTFMMLYYCWKTPGCWPGFCLYETAVFCHLFYISAASSYASVCMAGLCAFVIFSIGGLVYWIRRKSDPKEMLSFVLFEKTAFVPEILLNRLMSQASGSSMFQTFSWVLLALTSAYALACIVRMIQTGMLTQSWGIALGLLQFFFFTDILSCGALLILAWRWKAPEPEKKIPIYQKAAFSANKKMKPKR